MAEIKQIGAGGAIFLGQRDLTKHTKNYASTSTLGVDDETHLQTPGYAMTFVGALRGGAAQISAMLPVPRDQASAEMQQVLGGVRDAEVFCACPWGNVPGYFAEFFQVLHTGLDIRAMTANISTMAYNLQPTGGIKMGTVLLAAQGATDVMKNVKFTITLSNATGNATVTFYDNLGGVVGTVTVHPGDSGATIKAAIEALDYYGTVTVTGSTTALTSTDRLLNNVGTATGTTGDIANLTDGNDATSKTLDDNAGAGMDVTWDFGALTAIDKLRIRSANASQAGSAFWAFQGTVDGTWTDVVDIIPHQSFNALTTGGTAAWTEFTFTKASYRKVRLAVGPNVSGSATFYGVETLNSNHAGTNTSSGTYTIEVTSPAAVDITKPTTSATGYATAKTQTGVNLPDLNPIDDDFDGVDVDNGESTNNGGHVAINTVWASDDCNAVFTLQHADDDGGDPDTYSDVAESDPVTAAGDQLITIPAGTTLKQWTRIVIKSGDITGSLAASAALARNVSTP